MNLKEIRKSKNLTQAEVALMLNTSQSNYCKYEQGKVDPDINTLKKLAECLHTTVDNIIEHDVPYLLDKSTLSKEQNDIINEIRGLSNEDCQRVSAYIAGLKQGKQDQEYIIKKFKGEA